MGGGARSFAAFTLGFVIAILLAGALINIADHSTGTSQATAPPATSAPAASTTAATSPSADAASSGDLAAQGKQLFQQFGCAGCHSVTGQRIVGPPLNGVAGKPVKLAAGQTVTADDAYLKESIQQPDAKVVEGFSQGVMASGIGSYKSQLSQDQTANALIAYIKSLS